MNKNYFGVIMAGGVGTRFWPLSKTSFPKQFIDILGTGESLIQKTFNRLSKICPKKNIFIVTNFIYKDLVLEQLPDLTEDQVLCEPMRRNTAPCIAYANYKIARINPDANIVVCPSDHIILYEDNFVEVINSALKASEKNDWLVTLGIKPSRPDTGYGYIQFDESSSYSDDNRIYKVKIFTEKPKLELAKSFLQSGDFLWNSGIFIWSLKSIMSAFEKYLPEVNSLFEKGKLKYSTPQEQDFINEIFPVCTNISIDYGIMEKADNVYVLSSDFGWSDLGTWGSLYNISKKNDNKNTIIGNNVLTYNTTNCIINMPKNKLVVLQGLNNYIVVENNDILLICKKEDEQQIRKFVNDVETQKGKKFV